MSYQGGNVQCSARLQQGYEDCRLYSTTQVMLYDAPPWSSLVDHPNFKELLQ